MKKKKKNKILDYGVTFELLLEEEAGLGRRLRSHGKRRERERERMAWLLLSLGFI